MSRLNDTEYLYASSRVRALEKYLINRERMERLLEAKSDEDASKLLSECGIDIPSLDMADLETALAQERSRALALISDISPEPAIAAIFKIKYDYHNIKLIIKTSAAGQDAGKNLMYCGRFAPERLSEALLKDEFAGLPEIMRAAAAEAKDVLARTRDPQAADIALDRACFAEMAKEAADSGSDFLTGLVKTMIDASNLRIVVRSARTGKGMPFVRGALIPDGAVDVFSILAHPDAIDVLSEGVFAKGALAAAAESGLEAVRRSLPLTGFEKRCDDAVMGYVRSAKYKAFGEEPLAAYLYAVEAGITAVRTIISGRLSGVPADAVRERLREVYV